MIKNYRSQSKNTFDRIQKCLATHGAEKCMFDYDKSGRITALSFLIRVDGNLRAIKLPARLENVSRLMFHGLLSEISEEKQDQVYRTAWANIRDWIEAQMALIDIRMVKAEEVFLPYMVCKNGDTLFESFEKNKFLLPGNE